jgi:hypothetical protein
MLRSGYMLTRERVSGPAIRQLEHLHSVECSVEVDALGVAAQVEIDSPT